MIIQQHDVELVAFLNGGHNFLRHHQVGAIANQHIDLALRIRHFCAQSARDFVAHAGIAILHVISARCRVRQSLCKSPGKLPAAQTTMSGRLR